jgi:hypothetical protein
LRDRLADQEAVSQARRPQQHEHVRGGRHRRTVHCAQQRINCLHVFLLLHDLHDLKHDAAVAVTATTAALDDIRLEAAAVLAEAPLRGAAQTRRQAVGAGACGMGVGRACTLLCSECACRVPACTLTPP